MFQEYNSIFFFRLFVEVIFILYFICCVPVNLI